MFGSIGLPELILIGAIALGMTFWPALFFTIGYYFGRRSTTRNAGVPAAPAPPHV
jgi:hypothetical protein